MNKLIDKIIKPPAPFSATVFLPLFYALAAVYYLGTRVQNSLSPFTSRYIGIATLENFNVAARVEHFYLLAGLSAILFTLLFVLILRLVEKKIISSNELLILNLTSFCGLIFLYARLFGTEVYPLLRMLLVIHTVLIVSVVIRNIWVKKPEINRHFFSWIVIISFCLSFMVKKISVLLGFNPDFSFTLFTGLGVTVLIMFLRKHLFSDEAVNETRVVRLFEPLAWLPLLSVLSDEIYLILNQRGIFSGSPILVLAVLILALIIFMFIRTSRTGRNLYERDVETILCRRYFPVLLAGLAAFSFYIPVQNSTNEMFETANGVLPVQQFFEFGKIPLVDTFSSHMLSDFFVTFLYAFLNRYHNLCFSCYDFLFNIGSTLIFYYTVRKLTGSGYWAFFIALFYPYAEHFIPPYVCFALLPLLVLTYKDRKTTSGYVLLFFTVAFLIIWRIDLGFATAFATTAALLLFFIGYKENFNRKAFFKALLWVLSAGVVVMFFLLLIRGKNIFSNIQAALAYFSSAQSYGSVELASKRDVAYFSLYYFFPALVLAALGYGIFQFFTSDNKRIKMLCIALCYFVAFYFMNFQRGLVRHGLQELWDIPVTSFAFLIFATLILIFLERKSVSYSFIATTALMTLIISKYKFPEEELQKNGLYNSVYERMKHFPAVMKSKEKINRMPGVKDFAAANYSEIENFLDKKFPPEESFADFSNTPMLYYYLHRKSPHFFSQSPISYHSEKLQARWIKEVEEANTKLVLFSSYPETWFDMTDGVPNPLRHYLIAEYLYNHYHPGFILNDKSVWIRNNVNVQPGIMDTVYSATAINDYSFEDGVKKENNLITGNSAPSLSVTDISINAKEGKKYIMVMDAQNPLLGEEEIYFYFNNNPIPGKKSKWKYTAGDNTVFCIIPALTGDKITGIQFSLPKNTRFIPGQLNIVECNYVPDYYSTSPQDFNLRQLAYVWGNLDMKFKNSEHKILADISSAQAAIANYSEKKFLFNPVVKSEKGCYIMIRAKKTTNDKTDIVMNYGVGNTKSGGFVFDLPVKEAADYVIRVSTQYNWHNHANNWITIYPMGSDIEIEKIQIMSAD